ncbi:glycoside hydrolase family 13 protein [Fructobacillus ficulneus]|uniref:Oligo-1,6-glucosidase n=1 Tax=Fructobacillus ficulneus TaxID=157463 RepID=A0A0K8MIJ8_9LACO|nr:alpha-glucosidase [Fructobacillus ficulneus]GAP00283.1 oligo-1,6-glucosidase [Fructobacillus ficulneus]
MATQTKWWQKAVVYQIYPRSFQDSTGNGIGDLKGIESRLDYLKQLGVDVLWLNPIYQSPNHDNGYDISDYEAINPEFGTMADFQSLLKDAHDHGLKIVMDLVVNHTSNEHSWFIESRSSKDNPKRDYYIWRDPVDGQAPNNWGSFFSGPAWQLDEATGQYYLHLFVTEQPDLNWANPAVRDEVYQMMNRWIDLGIDGFRMDVISLISKPSGLPNGPVPAGAHYSNVNQAVANGPHVHEYLQEMRNQVLNRADLMTVGEASGVDITNAKEYANLNGQELNMVFQFEHVELDFNPDPALGKWDNRPLPLVKLKANLSKWQDQLYGRAWNSLFWMNHDQPRVVSRFGNDSPAYRVRSAKMLATVLHMLQGTPYIYQGEELGMTNAENLGWDDFDDIEILNARKFLVDLDHLLTADQLLDYVHYKGRDNARTPMQWSASANAGFTTGTPWLKLNANYSEINVDQALGDPDSVFYHYQKLIKLRHDLPIVTTGRYHLLDPDDNQVYAYQRIGSHEGLFVVANFTAETVERYYDCPNKSDLLLSNYADDRHGTLRPYEAKIYHYQK